MRKRHVSKALDKAAEIIDRATAESALSKQPRFDTDAKNARIIFNDIMAWGKNIIFTEPPYAVDSRARDKWLAQAVTKEPYLLGVLQSVVSIDRNRGFTITGGRNQVNKFTEKSHQFQVAPDLYGWRPGIGVTAQSYYQSNLGGVVEIGREIEDGPLAALYTVDPTKCRLTGSADAPLKYNGSKDPWGPRDYFRVVSFPNPNEALNGLGYCAVDRSIELAKQMVSVFEHYREQLGSKAPKGILTINGALTMRQWLDSLAESKAELGELHRQYYAGVQVLVAGPGNEIKVELTSLSKLPTDFNYREFLDLIMYGYALAFGYDPREFWPVSGGSLGTGKETETQHRKATSKGGLDFALAFQENYQRELPPTIEFEFEQRDVEGDALEIALNKAKWEIIDGMYKAVNAGGEPLITHEQAMQLGVEAGLFPETWTIADEDIQVTDTDDAGSVGEILERERVRRAIEKFPEQDIVRYSSSTGKYQVLRKAGAGRRFMMRAVALKPGVLADVKGVSITESDVADAMKEAEKRVGKKARKAFTGSAAERANGDDLRIMVDGIDVPRWFDKGKIFIDAEIGKRDPHAA